MSFSQGFSVGADWKDKYRQRKEEEIENQLFTAAQQLGNERSELDAEGNEIQQAAMDFSSMSPSDISGSIMQQAMANGLKMTDDLARLSYGVGETLFGMKEKYQKHQNKQALFGKKMQNMSSIMAKRNRVNSDRSSLFAKDDAVSKYQKWAKENGYLIPKDKTNNRKLYKLFLEELSQQMRKTF